MFDPKYLYLWIMFCSVILPFLWSFEKRARYYRSFKALFPAIAIVGTFFIIWDIIFTARGIWGFNERYLSGIYIANLPLGEWLFFIVIPFCCVFIYRVVLYTVKRNIWSSAALRISNFLIGFCAAMAVVHYDRWYTVVTFSILAVLIYVHSHVWKVPWLGRFYFSYLFILIPFFIVNGVLTGFGIEEEVVWYDDTENMGRRILTIPFEDAFYGMILILGVVSLYEYFGRKMGLDYAQETFTE